MTCSIIGASFSKLLIEPAASPHTFDASSEIYQLVNEQLNKSVSYIETPDLNGSYTLETADLQSGPSYVFGDTTFRLRPDELATLLAHLIGNESPSGTFTLADSTLPPFCGLLLDKSADVFEYADMRCRRWVVRSQTSAAGNPPQAAELIVSWIGKTRGLVTDWPGTPPTAPTGEAMVPFIHEQSVLTLDGTAYPKMDFVLACDYNLGPEWYGGTLTPSDICPQGRRQIQLRVRHPYHSGTLGLLSLASGVDGNLKFQATTSGGTVSIDFQFGAVHPLPKDPNATGPGKVPLYMDYVISKGASDPDLKVVLDHDPDA